MISTLGWGSRSITTLGWGGGLGVSWTWPVTELEFNVPADATLEVSIPAQAFAGLVVPADAVAALALRGYAEITVDVAQQGRVTVQLSKDLDPVRLAVGTQAAAALDLQPDGSAVLTLVGEVEAVIVTRPQPAAALEVGPDAVLAFDIIKDD